MSKTKLTIFTLLSFLVIMPLAVYANDLDLTGSVTPWHEPPPPPNSPTWQTDVDNGDGTFTFTQQVS